MKITILPASQLTPDLVAAWDHFQMPTPPWKVRSFAPSSPRRWPRCA